MHSCQAGPAAFVWRPSKSLQKMPKPPPPNPKPHPQAAQVLTDEELANGRTNTVKLASSGWAVRGRGDARPPPPAVCTAGAALLAAARPAFRATLEPKRPAAKQGPAVKRDQMA